MSLASELTNRSVQEVLSERIEWRRGAMGSFRCQMDHHRCLVVDPEPPPSMALVCI